MKHHREPPLRFLWHPATRDRFSGDGLTIAPRQRIRLLMVDRPPRVDLAWLAEIARAFGTVEQQLSVESGHDQSYAYTRTSRDRRERA